MAKKFLIITFMLLSIFSISFSSNDETNISPNNINTDDSNSITSNYFIKPFASTWSSLTNEDDTWGPENRSGQWHLGVMVGSSIPAYNGVMRGPMANVMIMPGYNFNKYFGIQYNQMMSLGGTFTGIGEGVIMIPTGTMVMPSFAGGGGWSNLSGPVKGAWDVGGGLNFVLSKHLNVGVMYRYIETVGPDPVAGGGMQQPNAKAAMSMVSAGFTWFFGQNK
ncbi:hypothetical protein ACFPDQ_02175 [Pseudofrancisella aestuarii]|uniref:Outer membrane protein beta-barrel domain-containing protein n=1 Tax=Pseudofrancisella aestuarii TaxID=2670347 RepID=A0ABV9TAD9_9GAMM|nr:hypothetical protein [Pseudofrancisella aestuarii]